MHIPTGLTAGQKAAARTATHSNALDLRKLAVIAIMGRPGARRAILRHRSGRTETVAPGSRTSGGTVIGITETGVILSLRGRRRHLALPA